MDQGVSAIPGLKPISAQEVQRAVTDQIAEVADAIPEQAATLRAIPVTFTSLCAKVDIVRLMKGAKSQPRVYWSNRDGDLEVGGLGATMEVRGDHQSQFVGLFGQMEEILSAQPDNDFVRFFGGTRFAPGSVTDQRWNVFPPFWFVLPQLMITRKGDDYFLTATALWDVTTDTADLRTRLLDAYELLPHSNVSGETSRLPQLVSRIDKPDRQGWNTKILRALAEIESGVFDKVVLARRCDLSLSAPIDPFDYLDALRSTSKESYAFVLEPIAGNALVGVSPEQLFKLTGNRLATEAVAGTIQRGKTPDEENSNSALLLGSCKDLREQQHVIESINMRLRQLCSGHSMSERPAVLKAANVQHLVTSFSGTIRPSTSVGDIYTTIHPTPAVAGAPLTPALEFLDELEGFDRGWYASGVGTLSFHETEMAVAIRTALVTGSAVSLFTGAGIVSGSNPDAEWEELEQKMAPALALFSGTKR